MALRCAVLDDYQNVVLKIADWSKVKADVEFKVFNEHLGGPDKVIAAPGTSQPCSATNPNGYDTGFAAGAGTCNTGGAIPGSVAPGLPGAGLNSRGQIIFTSGNVGNYTSPGELLAAQGLA